MLAVENYLNFSKLANTAIENNLTSKLAMLAIEN